MSSRPFQPSRRLLLLAPLAAAGLGGAAAWKLLGGMRRGTYDPRGLPSMLIGKKLPSFDLPGAAPLGGRAVLGVSSIQNLRRPALINFFASWCIPCVEETPVLMQLRSQGVPIYGIAYKDKPAAIAKFLAQSGNPYVRIGSDEPGHVAIDFGLYGVPETYVIDSDGIVRFRWSGALTDNVVRDSLAPMLKAGP
jgi:cytochrome c biogenesis protein CcmG/thiol:disulfide interchange protein DsbE